MAGRAGLPTFGVMGQAYKLHADLYNKDAKGQMRFTSESKGCKKSARHT
jgi:hypothetical protein